MIEKVSVRTDEPLNERASNNAPAGFSSALLAMLLSTTGAGTPPAPSTVPTAIADDTTPVLGATVTNAAVVPPATGTDVLPAGTALDGFSSPGMSLPTIGAAGATHEAPCTTTPALSIGRSVQPTGIAAPIASAPTAVNDEVAQMESAGVVANASLPQTKTDPTIEPFGQQAFAKASISPGAAQQAQGSAATANDVAPQAPAIAVPQLHPESAPQTAATSPTASSPTAATEVGVTAALLASSHTTKKTAGSASSAGTSTTNASATEPSTSLMPTPRPETSTALNTTSLAGPPVPNSTGVYNVDRIRYVQAMAPNREVQRIALDLDGARVAVRFDGGHVSVEVVSDPTNSLGKGWVRHVERTIDQTVRANAGAGTSDGSSDRGRDGQRRGDLAGDEHRRQQHSTMLADAALDAERGRRWANATSALTDQLSSGRSTTSEPER